MTRALCGKRYTVGRRKLTCKRYEGHPGQHQQRGKVRELAYQLGLTSKP